SAATLEGLDTAEAHYNRGTALAKAGQVDPAIGALERALELDPEHEDARFNLELLRQFKEQNPEQDQQQGASEEPQGGQDQQQSSEAAPEQGQEGEQGEQGQAQNGEQPQDSGTQSADSQSDPSDQESGGADDRQANDGTDEQRYEELQAGAEREADPGDPTEGEALAMDVEEWASEQAAEQWLRRIPQDPGGLLRRKFLYQYQRLGIDQDGNYVWPDDGSEPW